MKIVVIFALLFEVCHASSLHLPAFLPTFIAPLHTIDEKPQKADTTISNKNVNVVVTVDPKTVASELMKLIEERTGKHQGRRTLDTYHTMEDIEKVITPVLAPARRSNAPSAFETAYALDHITRRALTKDGTKPPTIEEEIATRNVVAEMMKTLRSLTEGEAKKDEPKKKQQGAVPIAQRSLVDTHDISHIKRAEAKPNDDDDLITLELEVSKAALRRALVA
ncbi:uncharacterized protein LOC107037181 [Diachasma alloeum]|uniref:uncharacterized protein LOC107037181 n=1 Tax=Diachasma alloeum TaxID=454923 RepID=UPI0007384D95|nr:uncharacterized protein LOC107037181 [Diachasma alloeum]